MNRLGYPAKPAGALGRALYRWRSKSGITREQALDRFDKRFRPSLSAWGTWERGEAVPAVPTLIFMRDEIGIPIPKKLTQGTAQ